MKPRSKMLDLSFRQHEQHIMAGFLEHALIIAITVIAIIAAGSILNEQIFEMI